jgi:hypothetical protein
MLFLKSTSVYLERLELFLIFNHRIPLLSPDVTLNSDVKPTVIQDSSQIHVAHNSGSSPSPLPPPHEIARPQFDEARNSGSSQSPPPPHEITQPQFDNQPVVNPSLTQDGGDATQAIEGVAIPAALGELLLVNDVSLNLTFLCTQVRKPY